ncbi:hypothetical protein Leryth_008079 [Lithospermum erythrorhizon]|nr:hypothetical protein Leryth_008079 [Lithospermum erythrorhizon]
MAKVSTIFGMSLAAFAFWETMDKVHVWIALHQDEKQDKLKEEAQVKRMRAELLGQQKEQDSLA